MPSIVISERHPRRSGSAGDAKDTTSRRIVKKKAQRNRQVHLVGITLPWAPHFSRKGGETMKKIAIREVETLKTTAAMYNGGCCEIIIYPDGSWVEICGSSN